MLSNWRKTAEKVDPYSQLAYIYDHVMRHVNYRYWANHLAKLFKKADFPVKNVLDISCGTASLLLDLAKLDLNVAGFDESSQRREHGLGPAVAAAQQAAGSIGASVGIPIAHGGDGDGVCTVLRRCGRLRCGHGSCVLSLRRSKIYG